MGGIAFIAFLAFCISRARNRQAAAAAAANATPASLYDQRSNLGTATEDDRKSTTFSNPASTGPADYASELPSPSAHARSEKNLWIPPPVASSSAAPPVTQVQAPPLEMPGSTYIHEHHPAYGVGEGFGPGVQPVEGGHAHTSYNGNMPSQEGGVETPSIVISPMEGPRE